MNLVNNFFNELEEKLNENGFLFIKPLKWSIIRNGLLNKFKGPFLKQDYDKNNYSKTMVSLLLPLAPK